VVVVIVTTVAVKTVATVVAAIPAMMSRQPGNLANPETIGDIQGTVTREREAPWLHEHSLNGETSVTRVARRTRAGDSLNGSRLPVYLPHAVIGAIANG
jgi:hypothetical protein